MTAPIAFDAGRTSAQWRKRQLYLAGRGFIYACPGVVTRATSGFAATILLPLRRATFAVRFNGQALQYGAVALRQLIERDVEAPDIPMLVIGVSPSHWQYRNFRAIPRPGGFVLDREAYADLDHLLAAAYDGQLTLREGVALFKTIVERTAHFLPRTKPVSRNIERALEMLRENPNYPLNELAAAVGLSYDRMSYLFGQACGLPLRSYLLWQKIHVAVALLNSGRSLTEIALAAGFSDSAHLSNTWQKTYGVPPSFFVNPENVQIHTADAPDVATLRPQAPVAAGVGVGARRRKSRMEACAADRKHPPDEAST